VRHVRMLGFCLAAVLVTCALVAGAASASKDPYNVETFQQYKDCPFNNPEFFHSKSNDSDPSCFVGRTSGGSKGGFFALGGLTVKLNKPIVLQGGYLSRSSREVQEIEQEQKECEANPDSSSECKVAEEAPEGFEYYFYYKEGALKVFPAEGGETLEAPELKVPGGLGIINKGVQERQHWPAALSEALKEARKNGEGGVNAKIEVAGNSLYTTWGALSTERLLFEEGPAFVLPLKVRLVSPFLERLGGGPCTIGNDANPIIQELSSAPPGRALEPGGFHLSPELVVELQGGRLTDLNWKVPAGGVASGCGGTYESYLDGAINEVLELPYQHGTTVLQGDLFTAEGHLTHNKLEEGHA
jgi:hypothetical protein